MIGKNAANWSIGVGMLLNTWLFLGRIWEKSVPPLTMKDAGLFVAESLYVQLLLLLILCGGSHLICKLAGCPNEKLQWKVGVLGIASLFISGTVLQLLALAHLSD